MEENKEESLFGHDAKRIVDLFFESKLFKEDVTRDQMNEVEKFVCYLLDHRYYSKKRADKLMESINNLK